LSHQAVPADLFAADVSARGRVRLAVLPQALGRWCGRYPLGAFGAAVIVLVILMAVFAPAIAPYSPNKSFADALFKGPSAQHLLGGDNIGRDVLSRVIYGSRVSLEVGLFSVAVGTLGATLLGLLSGFAGGWLDMTLQRVIDMFMAFPSIVLLLLIVAVFGPSLRNTILAISLFLVFAPSRIIRSAVLVEREQPYVLAERSLGATQSRILFRHIFVNIVPLVIVMVSIAIGGAILIEASLSFLGLGVPPPAVSWGRMIGSDARAYFLKAPWMAIFPGAALSLTIFAFNVLGDALRDQLDPRLRGR
jgi:peptide/nickel transport system permease protein